MSQFLLLQWLITQLVTRYPDTIQILSLVLYLETDLCLNWIFLNLTFAAYLLQLIFLIWFSWNIYV
jgi:hypothetical protein